MLFLEPPEGFLPVVSVSGCFIRDGDEFLLLLRSFGKSQGGSWSIPGGKLEEGESAEECVIRELKEETGLVLAPERVTFLQTVYVQGHDLRDFTYSMYEYKMPKTSVLLSDEHEAFLWVKLAEIESLPLIRDGLACFHLIYGKNSSSML